VEFVKKLDGQRPVSMVSNVDVKKDLGAPFMDILAINRYFSWYSDAGSLQLVQHQVQQQVAQWRKIYKKPLIFSEYGADAISGYHSVTDD
jgi:beta-glucuronidase